MSETSHGAGRRTNVLAIVGLILAIFVPLIGAIIGHIALNQIKKTGEDGRGVALAAVIVGWTLTALAVIGVILAAVAFVIFDSSGFV
jgi:hypothetical protein